MLEVPKIPKANPIDEHTDRRIKHRHCQQPGEAHALARQDQLGRAREDMCQRDGEDERDKDSDVLEHMLVLPRHKSHGPMRSFISSSCWNPGSLRMGSQTGSIFRRAMEIVSPAGIDRSLLRFSTASLTAPVCACISAKAARFPEPSTASFSSGNSSTAFRAVLIASVLRLSAR